MRRLVNIRLLGSTVRLSMLSLLPTNYRSGSTLLLPAMYRYREDLPNMLSLGSPILRPRIGSPLLKLMPSPHRLTGTVSQQIRRLVVNHKKCQRGILRVNFRPRQSLPGHFYPGHSENN